MARRGRGHDLLIVVPERLPLRAWAVGAACFVTSTLFQWSYCHVLVDTRACVGHLPDPLLGLIPHDPRWGLISWNAYVLVTFAASLGMIAEALAGGSHRIVRFGVAMSIVGFLRGLTLVLVPLCNPADPVGTSALQPGDVFRLPLGPLAIPFRPHARADLFFSGHVAAWTLILLASRGWPRPLRAAVALFLGAQVIALLGGRGHYTLDLVVAVPVALAADRLACALLAVLARPRARAAAASSVPAV
jgi:hypothetical protein